jgi:hypothetical protein
MEKRYQVFISSTYSDLQDERQEVMQALLELDCIPSGMELFPAANDDQWTLIKKVIDDCDYYMVIISGRYGSIGHNGQSYTEMEYRYAAEIGKPILGFIHTDPGQIPAHKCETSEEGRIKLDAFRELVKKKMCRNWNSPSDLGSQVSRSLIKLIKNNPGIGWVRGNLVPDESSIAEILKLRKQVEELQATNETRPEGIDNLASGKDKFTLNFSYEKYSDSWEILNETFDDSIDIEWDDIFSAVSPLMIHESQEGGIQKAVNTLIKENVKNDLRKKFFNPEEIKLENFKVSNEDFQTIKIQLRALGLIAKSTKNRSVKDAATYWTLTPYGDNVMSKLRAIRKQSDSCNK